MFAERRSACVEERIPWPDAVGLPLVGVPGETLFAGVTEQDMPKFYYDIGHLNRNGAAHFTRTVLPALLAIHAAS
jgi:hypothetical protein